MVTNLMRIDPIPEKSLKTWYHIDIERYTVLALYGEEILLTVTVLDVEILLH